jgi:hypothetical protein
MRSAHWLLPADRIELPREVQQNIDMESNPDSADRKRPDRA